MPATLSIQPRSAEELAAALRDAAQRRQRICLRGGGGKSAMGGPAGECDVEIRTALLSGVLQYEPNDLTVSVAAGTPWREFTRILAEQNQMIPLDPPCSATATVGGVIASNCSGPRRRLFGTARDMVIGMTMATLDGEIVKGGGMVVKNVAGLDTQKALIGSFGTLAALTSINFKLAPLPEASRTFLLPFATATECAAQRDRLLQSVLQPAAIDALNPAAARLAGAPANAYLLAVRAGGSARVLDRYAQEIGSATELQDAEEASFWNSVEEFAPRHMDASPEGSIVRVGHRMSDLAAVLNSSAQPVVARAGSGVAYFAFDTVAQLVTWMQATADSGWSRVVEWSSEPVRSEIDLWPAASGDLAVMERLKSMFDPQRLLNAGRLYGRI